MMAPSSKSSNSSSSRSSMPNNLAGQQLPRTSSQGHSMDVNYHKSRDRNLPVPPGPHNMPPHGMPHKMGQKQQDSGRSLTKDHSGRMPPSEQQQTKQNSGSSNKQFSSSSSSVQYGSNNQQMPPGGGPNQPTNKMDALHDTSRNMMHASRGAYSQPPPQTQQQPANGPPNNLLNFHQQQQGSRHSSSSSNNNLSNSNSLKHEQSKQQISVHMQQPTQTSAHNHKQIMPPDANYPGLAATQQQHELLQQQLHAASLLSNNYNKLEPLQHSDDHSLSQFTAHSQNPVTKTVSSMFSPDWNEKIPGPTEQQQQLQQSKQHQMPQSLNYNNNGGIPPHNLNATDVYAAPGGYNKVTGAKESSPPKLKGERDTPSKKEKSRSSSQQDSSLATGRTSSSSSSSSAANQSMLKTPLSNKLDMAGLNELAGTSNVAGSNLGSGGMKRPNDQQATKPDDDIILRDSKIRKLDNAGDIGKHSQVVNGIETNPDLVRNLLKESLCPPSALLKTENSIITPSLQPPAELFEPSATTSTQNPLHNTSATSTSATNILSGNSDVSAMETEDHGTSGGSGSKSEKKKKKDKHKHKEKDKDKSKDREERKKHKKDKDRHKDKERDRESDNAEHVKIKISKEKLESAGEPIGFKIKIPKDRIMGDLSTQSATSHSSTDPAAVNHSQPVLKIKISKDKLETYSSGSATDNMGSQAVHASYSHGNSQSSSYAPYGSTTHSSSSGTHTSSSSSKKKDRDREKDRERDKDKKRQHDSSTKSNSGSSSTSMTTSIAAATTNGSIAGGNHSSNNSASGGTTQKSQYSSKVQ